MQTGTATADDRLREAAFRERRRRVLRAGAAVAGAFVLGLLLVFAAKQSAPGLFEPAVAGFVLALFGSMGVVWRTANRHWRCPACDVRWATQDTLASFQWNHCPTCGASLRVHPREREQERIARIAFELEGLPLETLRARFRRRRRRAAWIAGMLAVAGLGALVWLQGRVPETDEWLEQAVAAAFTGGVLASLVWGMRCPRCAGGVVASGRHCMRCGFALDEAGSGAEPRGRRAGS